MSIVRIGMSEDNKFGDGYEAIFGKKTTGTTTRADKKPDAKAKPTKKPTAKKKPVAKKATKK